MNDAFMEGAHAAKKGKSIKDNPYRQGMVLIGSLFRADLWDQGFVFQMERECQTISTTES
jgi:hypothetical protein